MNVYNQTGLELQKEADSLDIITAEDLVTANRILKQCNSVSKDAEGRRLAMTQPVNAWIKSLIAKVREVLAPTEDAKATIKRKIIDYNEKMAEIRRANEAKIKAEQDAARKAEEEKQKKIEEENAKIEDPVAKKFAEDKAKAKADEETKAREAKEKMEADAMEANAKASRPKGMRTVRVFKIEDPTKVPAAFCTPNESLIRQAVTAGAREIDGVKIYSEQRVQ